jgi:hypothetical protein
MECGQESPVAPYRDQIEEVKEDWCRQAAKEL